MNIEEAKKLIDKQSIGKGGVGDIPVVKTHIVKVLLDQLDQPQPEVPQMIFDVIKSFDDDVDYLHQHMSRQSDEVREWLTHNEREFYEAWLAYPNITIEKEKLYTVEIPNPNSDLKIILVKVNKKLKLIEAYEDQLEEYKNIRNVTESEIRKDFDWAWQFRKDVENE
ncbi:TPA: DUF1642 domain-containing protein [Streptococcus agalactiae]|uniref:DUF1642 domain-containing protein n=2 Tax=Streptococcus agalactiae TaxID=1311 RepID=A0AAW3HRY2_STRAG|nr:MULTISPECIES: DUF1642 domain-containing protein [Streptococcus]QBX29953.1 hypothetical protein Javan52_0034 [Streptococcus phage Javan52]AIF86116.1 hypothetical protein EN72_03290 [Streptococcus agalactiae]EMA8753708.1 DUF1642 domain-containing protein [Streptococcus agalactiae]EMA8755631.1 DUF1642 domain-containing protein [Streptococcus agalactiae]EPT46403.1 hypothetical protein SAG0037_07845 [Streptococcus agalactiae FSL S3-337]